MKSLNKVFVVDIFHNEVKNIITLLIFDRKIYINSYLIISLISFGLIFPKKIYASSATTDLSAGDFDFGNKIGNITSIQTFFIFLVNVFKWFGWAAVVSGVVIVIAMLIYKLIFADDNEAMKKVQAGITKAIAIVVIGLVLVGAGFIVSVIGTFFGVTSPSPLWLIPTQLSQPP